MNTGIRPRIVVIEDNPADVELLRITLAEVNLECELTVLRDGAEAMDWIHGSPLLIPDLAVVDLNLPKHDGIELLEAMQAIPALARLPALVLSSSPSPRDIACVGMFPNTRYMTKPTFLDQYLDVGRVVIELLSQRLQMSRASGSL
jgi:CheY-like chemotaxis protein